MPYHVVLVHGTGACGARWTRESTSSLCAHLTAVLPEPPSFSHADWSGRNTHPERAEGARKLIEHVGCKVPADRPLVLVGHSHGGTVIAQALVADADLCQRVAGVVFLSTPFLQARLLPLAKYLPNGLAFLAGMVCAIGLMLGFVAGSAAAGWPAKRSPWLDGLIWAGMLAGAIVWATVFDRVNRWLGAGKQQVNDPKAQAMAKLLAELDLGVLDRRGVSQRSLLVRSTADEAAGILAAVQVLGRIASDLPVLVWKAPAWAGRNLMSKAGFKGVKDEDPPRWFVWSFFAAVLVGFVLSCLVLAAWLLPDWGPIHSTYDALRGVADRVTGAGVQVLLWAIWVVVLVLLTSVPLLLLGVPVKLLSLLAYGLRGWPALQAMFVELSVEPAPPGTWSLHQLDANDFEPAPVPLTGPKEAASARSETALAHSYVYDDARAHRVIAQWLSGGCGTGPSAGSSRPPSHDSGQPAYQRQRLRAMP